jgi:ABC-type lipoprotein release transport system permease subunit
MSRLGLLIALAWRNLWRNPRRTGVMLAAVIMGVWAMIFMNAGMRGMTDQMVRNGLNTLPGEAQVLHPAYRNDPSVVNSIAPPDARLRQFLDSSPRISAWTTRVQVPAVIASARDTRGVLLLGVDPPNEVDVGALPGEIIAGRFLRDADDPGVVIGRQLAERLETEVGKRVVITAQDPDNELVERGVRVVGVYRARLQASEEAYVYTGRSTAQALLHMGDRVSQIAVTSGDYRHVDAWLPDLRAAAGADVLTLGWTELDPFRGAMLDVQDGFSLVFILVVFSILSFGLVNTLAMAVFERVREIGLMQALGMRPGLIVAQVLLESLFMLVIGLASGSALAVVTLLPLRDGIDLSRFAEGMAMVDMDPMLYPSLYSGDIWTAVLVVLLLGLAASLFPALRAARLNPVRALAQRG